jgi:hypothetical protein
MWTYLFFNVLGAALIALSVFFLILGGHGNINGHGYQLSYTLPFMILPSMTGHALIIWTSIRNDMMYTLPLLVFWHLLGFFSTRASLPVYILWQVCGIRHEDLFCTHTVDMTWGQKLLWGGDPNWWDNLDKIAVATHGSSAAKKKK